MFQIFLKKEKHFFIPLFLVLLTNCSTQQTTHYQNLKQNIDAVFLKIEQLDRDQDARQINPSLPRAEAIYCIEAAAKSADRADSYQLANNLMLGSSAVFGGTGLALSAAAIGYEGKRGLAVSAAIFSILPGAILGTREIFKTYNVTREERLASARHVDTALSILRSYALLDNPSQIIDQFHGCGDNSAPFTWNIADVRSQNVNSRINAETATLEAAETEIQERRHSLTKVQNRLAALQLEQTTAENAVRDTEEALQNATTKNKEILESEHRNNINQLEAVKSRLEEAKQEAQWLQLALDRAIRIAGIQENIQEKTVEVIEAYAKLRRAVLYQSSAEVSATFDIAQYASSELEAARLELSKEKKLPLIVAKPRKTPPSISTEPAPVFKIAPLSNPYEDHP